MSLWWLGGVWLALAAFAGWAESSSKHGQGLESIELPERPAPRVRAPWTPAELTWSLALQGLYGAASAGENPVLAGFLPWPETERAPDGFSLGETVLALRGENRHFLGSLSLALEDEDGGTETALEELYVQTRSLPGGHTLRAGRFFSWVGDHNRQHFEDWTFVDPPLVYRAFLANKLIDDGLQWRWQGPRLTLGGEVLRGRGFPAGGGEGSDPDQFAAFLKLRQALGERGRLHLGLSVLASDVEQRHSDQPPAHRFVGDTTTLIAHLRWQRGTPDFERLRLGMEFFARDESGWVTDAATDTPSRLDGRQHGFYVETLVGLSPSWRLGLRYDRLNADNDLISPDEPEEQDSGDEGQPAERAEDAGAAARLGNDSRSPQRLSAMLQYRSGPQSRFRLQLEGARTRPDGGSERRLLFQYIQLFGRHRAH